MEKKSLPSDRLRPKSSLRRWRAAYGAPPVSACARSAARALSSPLGAHRSPHPWRTRKGAAGASVVPLQNLVEGCAQRDHSIPGSLAASSQDPPLSLSPPAAPLPLRPRCSPLLEGRARGWRALGPTAGHRGSSANILSSFRHSCPLRCRNSSRVSTGAAGVIPMLLSVSGPVPR